MTCLPPRMTTISRWHSALVYGATTLTTCVACAGAACGIAATMEGSGSDEGCLPQAAPPSTRPRPGRLQSAVRQGHIETWGGEPAALHAAGSGARTDENGEWRVTSLLPRSPRLLKMSFFSPYPSRTRTGGGPRDDPREPAVARTSSSRRPQQCRFDSLFSAIFAFLGIILVTSPANLGARRTNFNLGIKVVII